MSAAPATKAIVRRISSSYARFYTNKGKAVSEDLAKEQHSRYVAALQMAGLDVSFVDADDSLYDCVFVEDTAVICHSHALITQVGPDRRGEELLVERALQPSHVVARMPPGTQLEGGDVLQIRDTLYVGLSTRTNRAGIEALQRFVTPLGQRVVVVPVTKSLHLKTAATYLGDGTLLVAPGLVDDHQFDVQAVIHTHHAERGSANCLRINDHLLVPFGYPETAPALNRFAESHGVTAVFLDISEFEKGEGSLSCLSLIW